MDKQSDNGMSLNGDGHLLRGVTPNQPGPEFPIVQLTAGATAYGVILAKAVWGVTTHWNSLAGRKGRSQRCMQAEGDCAGCDARLPTRWKGYVHFLDAGTQREAFLEITPGAFSALLQEARGARTLRGLRMKASRGRGADNSRLNIELGLFAGSMDSLPAERDPAPILQLLWEWGR